MIFLQASFFEHIWMQFQQTSGLEWLGLITAFLCIFLATKGNILSWPISIISSGAYAILFFEFKLYGDSVLQLYFVFTAIYGWFYWLKRKKHHEKPIVSLALRDWGWVVFAIVILTALLSLFLDHYTDTDVPYADGFCTAMSFTAQFLLSRKVLQNWILWIIVDICYVPLLLYKDLASTAVLYLVLVVLAIIGYQDWKNTWKATK